MSHRSPSDTGVPLSALHQSDLLSRGKEMERKRKVEGKVMEGREVERGEGRGGGEGWRGGVEEGSSLSLRQ